jgi:hypothetical protein
VQGLGQVRTIGSVRALIGAAEEPSLRLAAIRAIAAAASPFVLRRTRNPDAALIRDEASKALLAMPAADTAQAAALAEAIRIMRGRRN